MSQKLSGKVAVVTGASQGLGASIARHLAAEGAAVVVNYPSSREGADAVVAEIVSAGGRAIAVRADVSRKGDIEHLFAETMREFGRLDVLVNNAGVFEFLALESITEEHFHRHFDVNVLGVLLATQEAVKHFGEEGGSIINTSSIVSTFTLPSSAVYSGTKAAVDALTRVLAKELGVRKIRVNAINPGLVDTEGAHAAGLMKEDFRRQIEAQTPLGRIGHPHDIAKVVVFLACADSGWINGETLVIAGGLR